MFYTGPGSFDYKLVLDSNGADYPIPELLTRAGSECTLVAFPGLPVVSNTPTALAAGHEFRDRLALWDNNRRPCLKATGIGHRGWLYRCADGTVYKMTATGGVSGVLRPASVAVTYLLTVSAQIYGKIGAATAPVLTAGTATIGYMPGGGATNYDALPAPFPSPDGSVVTLLVGQGASPPNQSQNTQQAPPSWFDIFRWVRSVYQITVSGGDAVTAPSVAVAEVYRNESTTNSGALSGLGSITLMPYVEGNNYWAFGGPAGPILMRAWGETPVDRLNITYDPPSGTVFPRTTTYDFEKDIRLGVIVGATTLSATYRTVIFGTVTESSLGVITSETWARTAYLDGAVVFSDANPPLVGGTYIFNYLEPRVHLNFKAPSLAVWSVGWDYLGSPYKLVRAIAITPAGNIDVAGQFIAAYGDTVRPTTTDYSAAFDVFNNAVVFREVALGQGLPVIV